VGAVRVENAAAVPTVAMDMTEGQGSVFASGRMSRWSKLRPPSSSSSVCCFTSLVVYKSVGNCF